MNINEQNEAIAKWIGLTYTDSNGIEYATPPNYTNDLNEIHSAVNALRYCASASWFDYQRQLEELAGSTMNCIQADASMRCEALLKTLGLWEEDNNDPPKH